MRRAALGVLRILLECRLDLDLVALIDASAAALPVQRAQTSMEVSEFIGDRLRGLLIERADGVTTEMVEAVLANRPVSPVDAEARLWALREFLLLPDAGVLTAINKRIANILRKAPPDRDTAVRPQLFSEAEGAEARLHRVVGTLADTVGEAVAARRYADTLKALIDLNAPVDDFFERIMVMDENPERRANRLALLRDVQRLLGSVADLSRLPG